MLCGLKGRPSDRKCLQSVLGSSTPTYVSPDGRPLADVATAVTEAIESPVGSGALARLVGPGKKVGILFDDVTRPTPVAAILPPLMEYLCDAGVREADICLVHSPGLHIHGENAIRIKVGERFANWSWLVDHDARHSPMVFRGITALGTPVWANAVIEDLDFMIGLGSITPHMDAGFSGGHKIVMPGIASKKSIDHHHCLMLSPKSALGRVDDNPVRQDIEEAGSLIGLDFVVNTVIGADGCAIAVFAGDPISAHRAGVDYFMKTRTVRLHTKPDMVIACSCSSYMVDCLKGLIRADMALRSPGTIVLYAQEVSQWARPGAVRTFATFPEEYMTLSTEKLAEMVVAKTAEETRHATAAFNFRGVCERHRVVLVANSAYRGMADRMGMEVVESLDDIAISDNCAIFLNAGDIFPVVD